MTRLPLVVALAFVCVVAPASAHMLLRGTPLHELAAGSPTAVVGVVESVGPGARVGLAAEQAVLGEIGAGPLQFGIEGHHRPEFAVGQRVLVFFTSKGPPFVTRQTLVVEVPGEEKEREALLAGVRAQAGLRELSSTAQRRAGLKSLSLAHLESASAALRQEALHDLLALGAGGALDAGEVAQVAALARRPDVSPTLGPGLVMLLASAPRDVGGAALAELAAQAGSAQVRALAGQALERRRPKRTAPAEPTASNVSKGRES